MKIDNKQWYFWQQELMIIGLLCLFLIFMVGRAKAAKQELFLLNNQINYSQWQEKVENKGPKIKLSLERNGQVYQINNNLNEINKLEASNWIKENSYLIKTETSEDAWLLEKKQDQNSWIQYQLKEEELKALYLSFEYTPLGQTIKSPSRPLLQIDWCGKINYVVLETEEREMNLAASERNESIIEKNGDKTKVRVPNPESCNSEQKEVKIKIAEIAENDGQLIKIENFSLNDWQVRKNDLFWIESDDEEAVVKLKTGTWTLAQGKKVAVARNDWENEELKIELIKKDAMVAEMELENLLITDNLSAEKIELGETVFENDKSLSGIINFSSKAKWQKIEFGAAKTMTELREKSWEEVEKLDNDHQIEWQSLNYVSTANGWQTFHLPAAKEWNQSQGFFLAARGKDWEERYTKLSNIYFCQNEQCQEVEERKEKKLQFEQIYFGDKIGKMDYIDIANTSDEVLNLREFYLLNERGEKVKLNGTLMPAKTQRMYLGYSSATMIDEGEGAIYLYQKLDEEEVRQDELSYKELEWPRNSYQKNLETQIWKVVYERE